jgi:uncharacterized membrane protein
MTYLILGLFVFLGAHSVRIFADGWRSRTIARIGENKWKGLYTLTSIAGFALIALGYGQARMDSAALYNPPLFMNHIAGLLVLLSFVLLAAAYVPGNQIKGAVGHPMIAGVKLWAFAHLLCNGRVADVTLFGAFLVWAIADFIVSRKRDRAAGTTYPTGNGLRTVMTVVAGAVVWAAFAFWLHQYLIGVAPFA